MVAFGLIAGACVTATGQDASTTPEATSTAPGSPLESVAPSLDTATAEPGLEASDAPADATPPTDSATALPADATPPIDSATPSPPSIGYIALDESQWYVRDISMGVRQATEAAGLDLVACDSGGTQAGVLACAAQLADAGVLGFISMQPFSTLAQEVCTTIGNVPAVGVVYDQGPCQISLLEVDQIESGRLAGAALGALAAERWECDVKAYVALGSGAGDAIGSARMDGYRAGFREGCKLPKEKRSLADAQHLITAQTQMSEVLDDVSGKPIIVAGVTDLAVLGALEAAAEDDRQNHVWAAGQLADPAARQAIACDQHYVASVAQFPDRFGELAVPALIDAIEGTETPSYLEAELGLVTSNNVRDLFPDTPACDT